MGNQPSTSNPQSPSSSSSVTTAATTATTTTTTATANTNSGSNANTNPSTSTPTNANANASANANANASANTNPNTITNTITNTSPPFPLHPNPRRRESIPALSAKASAAPPSASLESAAAYPTSTFPRPHSRGRSVTLAAAAAVGAVGAAGAGAGVGAGAGAGAGGAGGAGAGGAGAGAGAGGAAGAGPTATPANNAIISNTNTNNTTTSHSHSHSNSNSNSISISNSISNSHLHSHYTPSYVQHAILQQQHQLLHHRHHPQSPPPPQPQPQPQHSLRPASDDSMGNEQSRQKGAHHHHHHHHHQQHHNSRDHQTPPPKEKPKPYQQHQQQSPQPQSQHQHPSPQIPPQSQPQQHLAQRPLQSSTSPSPSPSPAPSPHTRPVNVPAAPRDDAHASRIDRVSAIGPADSSSLEYFSPAPSQFSRPPRLPLPIEEEVHTPGSPIISPADLKDVGLPRPPSVLSSATAEEDEYEEEFQPPAPGDVPTVPTLVEWDGPGERVYVTGTFAGWNRKFRLHRNGPSKNKNVLSAIINIAPGTHHLSFLVDNDMKTSDKLPTAVDYTNSLVNYLEVSLDDVVKTTAAPVDESKKPEPLAVQELRAPPGVYPPQVLPPTPELVPVKHAVPEVQKAKVTPPATPPKRYHSKIPQYLLDLDAHEDSSQFELANATVSSLPTPPTLPMFLSKSILNGTTPMKDDSSVLIMPNHTVLNHLATSSIKDNILATSATTRYKQKFLTTIMYKPKNEDLGHEH